jgi:hypothetical protein
MTTSDPQLHATVNPDKFDKTGRADRRFVRRVHPLRSARAAVANCRRRTAAAIGRVAIALTAAARWTYRNAEDVALVGGYAAIAAGAFWIFGPAGLIVGGLLAAGTALRSASAEPSDDDLIRELEARELEREQRKKSTRGPRDVSELGIGAVDDEED